MAGLATKRQILDDGKYVYNFEREIYFNREAKKAFSLEFVEDHSEEELQRCISENHGGGWKFYFNTAPSDAVKHELERVLG